MREDLEKDLQKTAPIFLQEMELPATQSCMAFGIECGDGWYGPLKHFCEEVEKINMEIAPEGKEFVAKQIKSKFGDIRVYYNYQEKIDSWEPAAIEDQEAEDKVKALLEQLLEECDNRCEDCGTEGAELKMINGWYWRLCPACMEKTLHQKEWNKLPKGVKG